LNSLIKANFFKKNKIKKRQFKKKTFLIKKFIFLKNKNHFFYRNFSQYTKHLQLQTSYTKHHNHPLIISISQKKFNPKSTLTNNKVTNTFTVGSIIKYFKVKQAKYIRRSIKGVKIFLNFLKNVVEKVFLGNHKGCLIFNIIGVDYNLCNLKKNLKSIIKYKNSVFFLTNFKISFTKIKGKKIKAIKKRLKKKIVLNFMKSSKNETA
jgi:hypothetical protein